MTTKLLTHQIIVECIAGTDQGAQNAKIAKILAIIMCILGASLLWSPDTLGFGIFCLSFSVLILILRVRSIRAIQKILKKEYTLQKDICVRKYTSTSSDGPDSTYLVFEKAGRCELNFPHVIWNSTAAAAPALYETANPGDVFYLLCVNKKRRLYMFNEKFWSVDTNDFSQADNIFIPRK